VKIYPVKTPKNYDEKSWLAKPVLSKLKPTNKRFSLRLTSTLVISIALIIVSISLALLALYNSTSGLENQKNNFERVQLVNQIETAQNQMVSNVLDYNLTGKLASLKEFQRAEVNTNQALNNFKPNVDQYVLYTSLQVHLADLNEVLVKMTELYDQNQDAEAIFIWRTKGSPLSTSSRALSEELIKNELQQANKEFMSARETSQNSAWFIIGLAGCALLLLTLIIHRRTEKALRSERDFALQVMNSIGQGLTVVDTSLNFQFVNPAFASFTGFKQGELVGKSALDLLPRQIHSNLKEGLHAPGANQNQKIEIALPRREGDVIYTEISTVPLLKNKETIGLISVFSDLTSYKKAEQDLRKSLEDRQQYAARLENLHRLDRAILAAHSSGEIAQRAIEHLSQITSFSWARVVGFDPLTKNENVLALLENPDQERVFVGPKIGPSTNPDLHNIAITYPEFKNDFTGNGESEGFKDKTIHLPLIAGKNTIGVLSIGSEEAEKFSADNLEIANEVASQLSIAIQHAHLFEQVQDAQKRLQALSVSLVKAQETERRRIARELHDEIGQAITALKISLQNLQTVADVTDFKSQLEESIQITQLTLQQVRTLSLELRPSMLDDLGLVAALRWYLDRVSSRAGVPINFSVDSGLQKRLPAELETVCFRLVQEAVTNILRHARAAEIWVELRVEEESLYLSIQDDGIGFVVKEALEKSVNGASMGLLGMLERVHLVKGRLEFISNPGEGSCVSAQFSI